MSQNRTEQQLPPPPKDVRMFAVGEICVHEGFICRVEAVERDIPGVTRPSLAYMRVKDGTEFNPTLTLCPLVGPTGRPSVQGRVRRRTVPSGAVERVADAITAAQSQIAKLEAQIKRLQTLSAPTSGQDP